MFSAKTKGTRNGYRRSLCLQSLGELLALSGLGFIFTVVSLVGSVTRFPLCRPCRQAVGSGLQTLRHYVWALRAAGAPAQPLPPHSSAGPPHASYEKGKNYPNKLLLHIHSWCWGRQQRRQGRAGGQAGPWLGTLHGQGIKFPSLGHSKSWCLEHGPGCRSLPKHATKTPGTGSGPWTTAFEKPSQ